MNENAARRGRLRLLSASLFFCLFLCGNAAAAGLRSPFEARIERAVAARPAPPDAQGSSGKARYLGGIAPHHDIALDMTVRFYERIASREARRVWLFSPDHFHKARKLAAFCDADWALAARILEADEEALGVLQTLEIAEANAGLFGAEHGITLHVPLVARYFPNASIVPMVLNRNISDMGLLVLRHAIRSIIGDADIVILSMDLSHYKPPEATAREDRRTLAALTNLESFAARAIDADARRAASLVLALFRDMGATRGEMLEHTDSSAILGERTESGTSYATVVYRANASRE
jgi:AmmeMemoRadiSam system protein B